MRPAHVVEILTPQKVRLNGLLYGPDHPKRVIVFIHGLTGSAFSQSTLATTLATSDTAVLTFSNRGHDIVASMKRGEGRSATYFRAGSAHEFFTDCVDDIDGAVGFASDLGAHDIFLLGHSTGCQKSVYWKAHTRSAHSSIVHGLMLLGPLSDYASALRDPQLLSRGVRVARSYVRAGKQSELLPSAITGEFPADAQRYLSLYTPDSVEEIFPYAQEGVQPGLLTSISVPIIAILAGKDEYADRPPSRLARWFSEHIASGTAAVVKGSTHSFRAYELEVAALLTKFMKESYSSSVTARTGLTRVRPNMAAAQKRRNH